MLNKSRNFIHEAVTHGKFPISVSPEMVNKYQHVRIFISPLAILGLAVNGETIGGYPCLMATSVRRPRPTLLGREAVLGRFVD